MKRLSLIPHQFGFFFNTVFTSGSRETSMNGPVPIACRIAKVSSLFLKSCGFSTLFFSHHALLMIKIFPALTMSSNTGFGTGVVSSTV